MPPFGDMFSKKDKPKRDPINRGEARQLRELDREEGPLAQSPIKGRKGPESAEEYRMRRNRRPRTSE